MVDIAMHMMDIAQNSVRANASLIDISFVEDETKNLLTFSLRDDGDGMSPELLEKVTDPFVTTRTTRRVGLGLPFLKMTAEQAGGSFHIDSKVNQGTFVSVSYRTDNVDCLPLGDVSAYLILLFIANPELDIRFKYVFNKNEFAVGTMELREQGIVDLQDADMARAIKEYVKENLNELWEMRSQSSYLS